jgi:hypothetical protein
LRGLGRQACQGVKGARRALGRTRAAAAQKRDGATGGPDGRPRRGDDTTPSLPAPQAERTERRYLKEQLDAALAAAKAAAAPAAAAAAAAPPEGHAAAAAAHAAEAERLERRAGDLKQRLGVHAARMKLLLELQQQLDAVRLDPASPPAGSAAAADAGDARARAQRLARALWERALALGLEPWQAFGSLLAATAALRARAERLRLRAEEAEADAGLHRRLGTLAKDEAAAKEAVADDLRHQLAGARVRPCGGRGAEGGRGGRPGGLWLPGALGAHSARLPGARGG